ncbi:hypothetical protein [Halalkalibacillus sediminis]|nr:hypothetical protein [Halalkalibacillus sediminis]
MKENIKILILLIIAVSFIVLCFQMAEMIEALEHISYRLMVDTKAGG